MSGGRRRVGSTADRLARLPYHRRVCRAEFHYPEPPPVNGEAVTGPSVQEWVERAHDMGVEMTVVSAEVDRGTPRFRSRLLPPHPRVDKDRLPAFLAAAHEKGIIVLTYYSFMYNKPLREIHPEWLMEFLDDGREPIENLGWFCFNSPFRDWLPRYLIEFLDHLDLDGFYFDDTNWGSHEGLPFYPSCCCRYCERLFAQETGLAIPRRVDFDSSEFRHFINWRYRTWLDVLRHVYRAVLDAHPGVIMDLQYYARPTTTWADGHPLAPVGVNALGGHYFIETHRTMRESGFTAKVGRAMGRPFGIWRNSFQNLSEVTGGSAPSPEPYPALLHGLSAIVNGGAPIFGGFPGPLALGAPVMKEVFAELKQRVPYMDGETVPYVALHVSQQNRDFKPAERARNTLETHFMEIGQPGVTGAYEALNRSHLLVDAVLDGQLRLDHLSRYPVLFLSDSTCLSDRQCAQIREYVHAGGTLIATHQTSLLDELGQARDDFALADVLGVSYRGVGTERPDAVIYINHQQRLRRALGPLTCLVAAESTVSLRSDSGIQVLCTRSSLRARPPGAGSRRWKAPLSDFDPRSEYDSGAPAVTLHRYGAGRALYVSADVGGGYARNAYPGLKRFIANLVTNVPPPIDVTAPQAIEITAATVGDDLLMVHLLNHPTPMLPPAIFDEAEGPAASSDVTTFFALQEVPPIHDVAVVFNDHRARSARLPLAQADLEVSDAPHRVLVPKVELHEVLVARLA